MMNLEEYWTLVLMALEPEAHINQELPLWVRNLRSKLNDSVFKEIIPLLNADPQDPKYAGFGIGAGRKLEQSLFDGISDLEIKTGHKMSQKERREIKEELSPLHDFEKKSIDKIPKADIDELFNFSASLMAGLESVYTNDGQLKHAEQRTQTVLFMLFYWPLIEFKFKKRKECFQFLKKALGKNVVGSYKTVEKFFERIGYSPARVGRPKKS